MLFAEFGAAAALIDLNATVSTYLLSRIFRKGKVTIRDIANATPAAGRRLFTLAVEPYIE